MAWGLLVGTAFYLWNAHQLGSFRSTAAEPIAFLLAAFGAFVGVFAWMLFNPNQRTTAESPSLFLAAAATLFPPPIIGFCLMPYDSPLKWWLALGIFLLVVIAILSHVPDEFFGVPRGRHSYVVPLPAFDRMSNSVMDPNASWFTFNDLSTVVADGQRPSLAPRSYLNRDQAKRPTTAAPERRVISDVDDILGSDFDIGLLDDAPFDLNTDDRSVQRSSQRTAPQKTRSASTSNQPFQVAAPPLPVAGRRPGPAANSASTAFLSQAGTDEPLTRRQRNAERQRSIQQERESAGPSMQQRQFAAPGKPEYTSVNPESSHLRLGKTARSEVKRPTPLRYQSKARRLAASIELQPQTARTLAEAYNLVSSTQPVADVTTSRSESSRSESSRRSSQQSAATNESSYRRTPPTSDRTSAPASDSATSSYRSSQRTPVAEQPASRTADVPTPYDRPSIDTKSVDRSSTTSEASTASYRRETARTSPPTSKPEVTTNLQSDQSSKPSTTSSSSSSSVLQAGASLFGVPVAYAAASKLAEPAEQGGDTRSLIDRAKSLLTGKSPQAEASSAGVQRVADTVRTPSRYDQPAAKAAADTIADLKTPAAPARATTAERSSSAKSKSEASAFERTKADDGSELVEGVMTIRFDKGQKRANLHIPFSPPLPGMPEVECECVGDADLRLKVPVRQSYGIRIEARRTDADEELEADIGFAAVYSAE